MADRQVGMFDAAELCGQVIPEDSFYALLAEHGQRIVSDADFADCYSEGRGRPSIPPSLLAKVLLLAYREGASDERAIDCLRFDLRWKVALSLPVDHPGFHPTTLVKFRARLLLHGKERLALERTVELATELGLMEGQTEQIVDSTPMLGAAATQDTVRLVRSGVRKLIDAVAGEDTDGAGRLESGLDFDYERPREKPDCDWRQKRAREGMLTEVALDAERALRSVERAPELREAQAVKEAYALLRELIGQDFDVSDDGIPRLHRGTREGRILSVHDPEMRHGRKSSSQRFDGYKLHASATSAAQPIVTAVDVQPACEQDGPQAKTLVDQQSEAMRPQRLLGDTAYGGGDTRAELAERGVDVLAPVPETPAKEGRVPKGAFSIDLDTSTVTCPVGEVAQITTARSGMRQATFPAKVCRRCPLVARCTKSDGRRQIKLQPHEELLQAGRAALTDKKLREHLRRRRPLIERSLGLLAHRYRARKSRYWGRRKASLQAAWTAAIVNLHPLGAVLRAEKAT
ncbi:MAG TPA: IS1182 family transposase [Thermoleophilaceae bacterium]|nr:IS1182 family transposase [Thermoleophilaceae bacterium]